jgi:RimJ/RimL family protein N-acetyltransferase
MSPYQTMPCHLETERLILRPWAEPDATLEEPEIAYELFRHAHGRGYATEAAGAVLGAAKATGRKRLWSTVGAGNAPSLRVLEKLGFERDRVSTEAAGEVVWLTRLLP